MPHVIGPLRPPPPESAGAASTSPRARYAFGEGSPNPFADGGTISWPHLGCPPSSGPPPSSNPRGEDGATPGGPRLLPRPSSAFAIGRLPRLSGAERDPSGRAECRSCQNTLEKGAWRVPLRLLRGGPLRSRRLRPRVLRPGVLRDGRPARATQAILAWLERVRPRGDPGGASGPSCESRGSRHEWRGQKGVTGGTGQDSAAHLPGVRLLLHPGREPLHDVIGGGAVAHVLDRVRFVRGHEEHRAPGPPRRVWPAWNTSTVPSLTMMTSSSGWVCGAWDACPGGSVVTWISSSSRVAVAERTMLRAAAIGRRRLAWISSQEKVVERRTGAWARPPKRRRRQRREAARGGRMPAQSSFTFEGGSNALTLHAPEESRSRGVKFRRRARSRWTGSRR